jgi:hypothetical protein
VLENWKFSGMQPDVAKGPGPAKRKPSSMAILLHAVVENEARQLAGGVNVVVSEPTDMLALLLHSKVLTDRLRPSLRHGASGCNLIIGKEEACWKLQLDWKLQRSFPEVQSRRLKVGALSFNY